MPREFAQRLYANVLDAETRKIDLFSLSSQPFICFIRSFVRLFIHGYIPFGIRNLDDKQPVADSDVS